MLFSVLSLPQTERGGWREGERGRERERDGERERESQTDRKREGGGGRGRGGGRSITPFSSGNEQIVLNEWLSLQE